MNCEFCKKDHDGSYGSGRFCSSSCSRSFSSRTKTKETYLQVSKKLKGISTSSKGKIFQKNTYEIKCIYCNHSFFKKLAVKYYESNRYLKVCENCLIKQNSSHIKKSKDEFYKIKSNCGKNSAKIRLQNMSLLSWEDSPFSEKVRRILKEQNHKCFICKINSWNEKPIILQIHHVDGNRYNTKKENIQFLCPNCHSQTDNFTSKNSAKYIDNKSNFTDQEFIDALKSSKNIRQALIKLNSCGRGGTYERAYKLLKQL